MMMGPDWFSSLRQATWFSALAAPPGHVAGYRIWVRFRDGRAGIVDRVVPRGRVAKDAHRSQPARRPLSAKVGSTWNAVAHASNCTVAPREGGMRSTSGPRSAIERLTTHA